MPLSDLYRVNKGKVDSNQDFETGNDLFELVWEKGQVMMQGQSSKPRKGPGYNNSPSDSFPPYSHRIQDKDVGNHSNGKTGKFGTLDSVFNEISTSSMPSGEIGLNQDEDVMTWLNYRIDESLQQEYCPDFMPELSSVTVHELSTCNSFLSLDKTSFNPIYRNSSINSSNDVSKVTSVGDAEVSLPRSGSSQLYPSSSSSSSSSSSQQCQSSFPFFRSGISDIIDGNITSVADHAISYDSGCVLSSSGSFPSSKMQNLDPIPPRSSSSIRNFSHFSSSVALLKDNLQKVGSTTCSNLSSMERITNTGKDTPAASDNPPESAAINSICGSRQKTNSQCQVVASGVDLTPVEARLEEPCAEMQPAMVFLGNASKNDARTNQVPSESAIRGTQDADNTVELVVASSVCSVSSVGITSDDPTHGLKRKSRDADELECHSENAEEESVGVKKTGPTPATSSKRGRAAEVHNLSERRRRDRINEKMRALQELIPNCNKVDKASMLEDAIEYLKSLQLQVQIMSMGTGMYMQTMMLPTGMQQMQSPHMAHFSHMGVGMGTGMYMQPMMLPTGMQQMQSPHMAHLSHMGVGMEMGMGYGMAMPDMNNGASHYPMMRLPPPMQGAPFPGPPMSGHTVLPGMAGSNHQVLGVRGQGFPMQMQRAPFPPVPGGHFMKSSMDPNACAAGGSTENVESVLHSTSKVPMQNINLQVMQSTGINGSLDPIASQIQATNEGLRKSTTGRNNVQVSVLNGGRASDTVNENYVWPSSAAN